MEERIFEVLERIAVALERLAEASETSVAQVGKIQDFQMKQAEEHLGIEEDKKRQDG